MIALLLLLLLNLLVVVVVVVLRLLLLAVGAFDSVKAVLIPGLRSAKPRVLARGSVLKFLHDCEAKGFCISICTVS